MNNMFQFQGDQNKNKQSDNQMFMWEDQKPIKQEKPAKKPFNPRDYEKYGFSVEQIVEIKQTFDVFDRDKEGNLSIEELEDAMQILGFIQYDSDTLNKIIDCIDKDKNRKLDFGEFIGIMYQNIAEKDTDQDLLKIFEYFVDLGNSKVLHDEDDDEISPIKSTSHRRQNSNKPAEKKKQQFNPQKAKISIQMLRNIAKEIGEEVEDEDLIEMLERADQDDDGQVGFEDFKYIVKWKSEERQEIEKQMRPQQPKMQMEDHMNTSQNI